jgi:hypothetical protein
VWVGAFPVAVAPSPKFQLYVYGDVPPDAVAVKLTDCPVFGEEGVKLKSPVKGGITVKDCEYPVSCIIEGDEDPTS